MQERIQKKTTRATEKVDTTQPQERDPESEQLLEDTDELLDEIDELLEEAEEDKYERIVREAKERLYAQLSGWLESPCGCGGDDLYSGDDYGF